MQARRTFRLAAGVALAIAAWAPAAASAATPVVTEFGPLPTPGAEIGDITTGPDGNLWYVKVDPAPATFDIVGRITPAGVVTQSPLTGNVETFPLGITAGPDGNVWLTEEAGQFISRVTPATPPVVTAFPGDAGMAVNAAPAGIVAGPDGGLWYTDRRNDAGVDVIGRFIPTPFPTGTVVEYSVGGVGSNPNDITVGPDGNLWFTEPGTNSIGRITTGGTVSHFSAGITAGAKPVDITTGPDGNLWFTELDGNRIGRINPTTQAVTEFPLPAFPANRSPYGIAAGPDGNLWFTERTGVGPGAIARIDPVTGLVTEYPSGGPDATPGLTAGAEPLGITAGSDGNMWFTERSFNRVGRINTPLDPTAFRNSAPIAIPAVGPAALYPSEIAVSGLQGTITGVRVELTGISHASPDDIDALLVGPQGQQAMLVADVGGTSVASGVTLNLLDSAPYSALDGGPLGSGMFIPANSLAIFNGSDPNGTWKLFVDDDAAGNSGAIHGGWGIDITTTATGGGGDGGGGDGGGGTDTDADDDGVADGTDRCAQLGGAAPSGCPDAARKLTFGYSEKRQLLKGKLSAPTAPACASAEKVRVFRKKPGPDKRTATAKTKPTGKWSKSKELPEGKFYAQVKPRIIDDLAACGQAKSKPLTIR